MATKKTTIFLVVFFSHELRIIKVIWFLKMDILKMSKIENPKKVLKKGV